MCCRESREDAEERREDHDKTIKNNKKNSINEQGFSFSNGISLGIRAELFEVSIWYLLSLILWELIIKFDII